MAIALDKLIDLNLLERYDGKVKDWMLAQLENNFELTTDEELPEIGIPGKTYITQNEILTWDEASASYISIGGSNKGCVWESI